VFEDEFPFSNSAVKKLEQNKTNLSEISADELEGAKNHIMAKISGRIENSGALDRIKTFAISRILLASAGSEPLSNKFAAEEIKEAVDLLQKDEQKLDWLAKDLIPTLNKEEKAYSISLFEFVEIDNSQIIKRNVENGRVTLEKGELVEILRKMIRKKTILATIDESKIPARFKESSAAMLKEADAFLPKAQLGFRSKTLELPCMKKMIERGAEEGKRYYGSLAVSIACFKDNLSSEKAEAVMKQYVASCQKGASEFTLKEGLATLLWVYKRKMNRLSCRQLKQQGFGKIEECKQCKVRT